MGISIGIGADSTVTTLSAWVLSLAKIGSDGGTKASVGAPYAATAEAEAMASTTSFASSKKPSIGVPAEAGTSSLMG